MARPQTIQIYLPSGDPAGLRVADLTTRTVRVFEVPRSLLTDFLMRPEASQVGCITYSGPTKTDSAVLYRPVRKRREPVAAAARRVEGLAGRRPWWRCP